MPVSRETSHLWTAQRRPEWRLTVVRPNDEPAATPATLDGADDRALATRAAAGDRDAFDVLVIRHQRAVYQVCFRFVRDHAEASDAMQDAFLRAWRALPRFKGDAAFATWLYRVAVNTCLSRLAARRPAANPLADAASVGDPRQSQAASMLQREQAAAVRRAVDQLPGRQRATVILRVFHDLPHAEIATVLGSSVGSVKANFFHALRNLRRLLGGDGTR
ncbi:MAG: sigma-70 family RNA polymerase sigma factor [Vicinamibacteria bacterium]|nr:sigma-70 family RNA polymerase sigma factor [Vicinamibacteria bacterium]